MITAVDSNILIDIFLKDKTFAVPSKEALIKSLEDGSVIACGVVLVEAMTYFPSVDIFFESMSVLGVQSQGISKSTFVEAGQSWQLYKQRGGSKNRVVADFIIGAHALVECDRLLTRDRGFYRQYFKKLKVIGP
jgi:predicted nucleic acid-binding protein